MTAPGLLVVGSGPGGFEAVRAFREADANTAVTMITADPDPPYNRPPLTKDYLRGDTELADLWLAEEKWFAEHGVELRLDTAVAAISPEERQVRLADGSTLDYRDLVLATGSRPRLLELPGGQHPGLVYVRDRASGDRLRDLAAAHGSGPVAVIGSGFIGCEVAANLAAAGREVVLLTDELVPHASRLGPEAGERIADWLTADGVALRTGSAVAEVRHRGSDWEVELADGSTVPAAAVVCGGGAVPNVELGVRAGLAEENGGLVVDASLRTADPNILAVGDIAYAHNVAAGRRLRVEHWGDAETHGRIAGTVAAGGEAAWRTAPGFWSELGERTLKYAAWEPKHDDRVLVGSEGAWAVWYRRGSALAGVLAYNNDTAYERGQQLLERNASFAEAVG